MSQIKLFLILTIICGIIYPLGITGIAQVFFTQKANGSLIKIEQNIIGSKLIAQKFTQDKYFHPRPSAADFATVASGASQYSPTNKKGANERLERQRLHSAAAVDFWTTSASGLDPHLSLQSIKAQIPRVAAARDIDELKLINLVDEVGLSPTLGIWGRERVNVLELNLKLDEKRF